MTYEYLFVGVVIVWLIILTWRLAGLRIRINTLIDTMIENKRLFDLNCKLEEELRENFERRLKEVESPSVTTFGGNLLN